MLNIKWNLIPREFKYATQQAIQHGLDFKKSLSDPNSEINKEFAEGCKKQILADMETLKKEDVCGKSGGPGFCTGQKQIGAGDACPECEYSIANQAKEAKELTEYDLRIHDYNALYKIVLDVQRKVDTLESLSRETRDRGVNQQGMIMQLSERIKALEPKACTTCKGSGIQPHSEWGDVCTDCGGMGKQKK